MRALIVILALAGCASPSQQAASDCAHFLTNAPGTRAFADCSRDQAWAYEDAAAERRQRVAPWLGVAALGAAMSQPAQTSTTTVWWWR